MRSATAVLLVTVLQFCYAQNNPSIRAASKLLKSPVHVQIWQWGNADSERKAILEIRDGASVPLSMLPRTGIHFKFTVGVPHDSVRWEMRSEQGTGVMAWGPEAVPGKGSATHRYRGYPETMFVPAAVGKYSIQIDASDHKKTVASETLHFTIVDNRPIPTRTHFMVGKRDAAGHPITTSQPVDLPGLNETPVLLDNDYPFEPQHAGNVVNFERFPPFHLPDRFTLIWGSRRFLEEPQFGGPLNRGFTAVTTIDRSQDNLPIGKRMWFHTPDQQVEFINNWYRDEPQKYADLKGYADFRSPFVAPENAFKLGWECYASWGAAGYGPYDAGIYGWDEEQMWPSIAEKLYKERPDLLPAALRTLKQQDPDCTRSETRAALVDAFVQAWGNFIADTYRGARACAATRGRKIKVYHYGSKAPGETLFYGRDDGAVNPETGRYRADEIDSLWPWFKYGSYVDFKTSQYCQQIDYFNKDFYFHTLFPQSASMYERDSTGTVILEQDGRRRVRKDLFKEHVYVDQVEEGYEDCETGPAFLKEFVAKGENTLYWMNGGAYYKRHGSLVTDRQLIPTIRPGNQETWGEAAKLGSRPVNPYLAEATTLFTFLIGIEGVYLWDSRNYSGAVGYGPERSPSAMDTLGDMEFQIKGMHRISQFNKLFEGAFSYVRPVCMYDTWNRDHPIIRGLLNGRYLLLGMTNPYLDPGEVQTVEVRYGSPFGSAMPAAWSNSVTLHARKNHLFQCKLPPLSGNGSYDPDRLYFRYTCVDGQYRRTFESCGNYSLLRRH